MKTAIVTTHRDHPVVAHLGELLQSRLTPDPPQVVSPGQVDARCREDAELVVFFVLTSHHHDSALQSIRKLRDGWAGDLLVVGPATDAKLILRAMQAGADLFLDESDLGEGLSAAIARIQARRGVPAGPGQLHVVVSASGGCGASTIAVNLAALIARARGGCNLIDLNAGKADLAPLLDLKPQYTIADLCRNEDRLDRTLFEKLLTTHPSGIELLAAPREFEDVRSVTVGGVTGAIDLAREVFADVVVDLEDCFHEEQVAVVTQATRVFLVCRLDFTAVRNTRRVLDHLEARGVPRDRVEVVVNQSGLPNELPVVEAEIAIAGKFNRFIPHDPETIGWANNTGIPAAFTSTESPVVQGIAKLVGLESPPVAKPSLKARLQSWWKDSFRSRAVPSRDDRAYAEPSPALSTQETKVHHESIIRSSRRTAGPRACPV